MAYLQQFGKFLNPFERLCDVEEGLARNHFWLRHHISLIPTIPAAIECKISETSMITGWFVIVGDPILTMTKILFLAL